MKIVVASNNKNKIIEIREILCEQEYEILSLKDVNLDIDPEEIGNTFEENALIKAKAVYNALKDKIEDKFYVLADDSGLVVEYLNGQPGVLSARYSGDNSENKDKSNNKKLLRELSGVSIEDRKAAFVCAIAFIGKKKEIIVTGKSEGYIILEEKGFKGFGYDPLFYSTPLAKTFAEASSIEKNSVSHRGMALKNLKKELEK